MPLPSLQCETIHVSDTETVFDADVARDGTWIALVGRESAESALYIGDFIRLSRSFKFPVVCIIDEDRFVIVDRWAPTVDVTNAWIASRCTPWNAVRFQVGHGVQDVLVTENFLICTYFDEGVFGGTPYSREGVAAFDFSGNFVAGYRTRFAAAAVDITDCYAACCVRGDTVAFTPLERFPLVTWNIAADTQSWHTLPGQLHGAAAMSERNGEFLFHSPYKAKSAILAIEGGNVRELARVDDRLKTLCGGRFLQLRPDRVSILTFDPT